MRVGFLIVLLQCSALSFGKVVKLAPLETEGGHLGSEAEHVHGMIGSSEEDDSSGDGSAVLRKPKDSPSEEPVGKQKQRVAELRVKGANAGLSRDEKEKNKDANVKAKSGAKLRKVHKLLQSIKQVKDAKQHRTGARTSQTKVVKKQRQPNKATALAEIVTVSSVGKVKNGNKRWQWHGPPGLHGAAPRPLVVHYPVFVPPPFPPYPVWNWPPFLAPLPYGFTDGAASARDYLKLCKPYKALMERQKRRRLLRLLFGFASPARPTRPTRPARMQKITLGHIEKYSKRCALPQYPWGYPWQPPGAQVSDKTPELPGQQQQLSSNKVVAQTHVAHPGFP